MSIEIKPRTKTVTEVTLPMASHGFRSDWAHAIVDGAYMRLHVSQSDRTDYQDHLKEVARCFAAGLGESCPR